MGGSVGPCASATSPPSSHAWVAARSTFARRPDGFDLRWKQIGINDLAVDPQRPFFVQWQIDDEHHPSTDPSKIALTSLEFAGDEAVVDAYLGISSSQPLDGIDVIWEVPLDDETGVVAAVFDTPNGEVRLD